MGISVRVISGKPQHEIASLIQNRLSRSVSTSLISGFVTIGGLASIARELSARPTMLSHLVVGAGTFSAFSALDSLIAAGIPQEKLFVHLGMSRTSTGKKNPFQRFHPMLHSKVYLFDMGGGISSAFVGSQNLTTFALHGLNGETGILLEGDTNDPAFVDLQKNVNASVAQSVRYDPSMKEAYAWWTGEWIDGLRREIDDAPRDAESRRTIVVLAAQARHGKPKIDDVIYFEIPEGLGAIQSLQAEVHVYLFAALPASPGIALNQLETATTRLFCKTTGIELGRGAQELRADWFIQDRRHAELMPAPKPFRPSPESGMQQIRVIVSKQVLPARIEYLFEKTRTSWAPVLDDGEAHNIAEPEHDNIGSIRRKASEEGPWFAVRALRQVEPQSRNPYELALLESSPNSGSFILMSPQRRRG